MININSITEEQILAIGPGKELDALVAVEVMGWSIYHYDKDVEERCFFMLVDENFDPVANDVPFTLRNGERKTEEEAWKDNRPWSTDISAAWEVVEKMKSLNWWSVVSSDLGHPDGDWSALFFWDPNGESFETRAQTAPEAIVKAALLAKVNA
jgi:hypothetical protein